MRVVVRQSGDGENSVEIEERSMRGAGRFGGREGAGWWVEAAYVCWHGGREDRIDLWMDGGSNDLAME
jgi:hypothetical protein